MAELAVGTSMGVLLISGPPIAPSNLVATANGQTQVVVTWDVNSTNELNILLERSLDNVTFLPFPLLDAGTEEYTDNDTIAGTTYYYRVYALGRKTRSSASNIDSATTTQIAAPTVTDFVADHTNVSAGSSIIFTPTFVGTVSSVSWLVNGVEASTAFTPTIAFPTAGSYTIKCIATNAGGSGELQKVGYITISALASPLTVSATISANGTTLTYVLDASVTGHTGLTFRDGSNVAVTATYVSGDPSTTLVFTLSRTLYQGEQLYRTYTPGNIVSTVGSVPLVAFSTILCTNNSTQQPAGPSVPTFSSATTNTAGSYIDFTFSENVTGSTGLTVAASGGNVSLTYASGTGTSVLRFNTSRTILDGETLTTSYSSGDIVDNTSLPLAPFSAQTVTNISNATAAAPGQPDNLLAVAASDSEIALTWRLPDRRGTAVKVYRSPNGSTSWSLIASLSRGVRSHVDRSGFANTTYYYRVSAENAEDESSPSATVSCATMTERGTSAAPTNVSATANTSWKVTFSFKTPVTYPAGNGADFRVERSTDGIVYSTVGIINSAANTTNTFVDEQCLPEIAYTYRTRAVTGAGWLSPYSTPTSATTPSIPSGYPVQPSGLSISQVSATQCVITWIDNDAGQSNVIIQTAPPSSATNNYESATFTQVGTTTVGATTHSLTTIPKDVKYLRIASARGSNLSGWLVLRYDDGFPHPIRACSAGSAVTYNIGEGQTYATWAEYRAAVGAPGPGPGSTIRIHGKVGTSFHDAYIFNYMGLPNARITIEGVADANGDPPVIDLNNSVRIFGDTPDAAGRYDFQDLAGIIFGALRNSDPFGFVPGYLDFVGFEVKNAYQGNSYTAHDGTTRVWPARSAAGIYIIGATELEIRDCVIHDNGNGIFGADNTSARRELRNIRIIDNHLYDNGISGSFLEHNTYIEGNGEYYRGNRYGPLRGGAQGGMLKTRGVKVEIVANYFESGTSLALGLVAPQNCVGYAWLANEINAGVTMYGNIVIARTGDPAPGPIRFGGDSTEDLHRMRRGLFREYHNTFVSIFDSASRSTWVQDWDARRIHEHYNTLRYLDSATEGSPYVPANVLCQPLLNPGTSCGVYSGCWISPNPLDTWTGTNTVIKQGFDECTVSTTNNPAFVGVDVDDFIVLESTEAAGIGVDLPDSYPPCIYEWAGDNVGTIPRTDLGAGSTAGAFASAPDTTPPSVTSATTDVFGASVTITFTERVTSTGTGWSFAATGGAITGTYGSGSGTTTLVFNLSRTLLASETITRTYSSASGDTQDTATIPNELVSFTAQAITNISEETSLTGPGVRGVVSFVPTGVVSVASYTRPGNASDNDLYEVGIYTYTAATTITPPSGFTLLQSQQDGYGGGTFRLYSKQIGLLSSEPATYDFTLSAANYAGGALARISGQSLSSPEEASAKAAGTVSLTQVSPSVTTLGTDRLIVRWLVVDRAATVDVPSGYVKKAQISLPLQFGGTLMIAVAAAPTAGATGTANLQSSIDRPSAMITVAIKPLGA